MQAPKYYKTEFDRIAGGYDLIFDGMTFFQIKKLRRKAIDMLNLKEGDSAIDFACGTGGITTLLAEKVGKKGKVVGIDLSEEMLKIAIKKSRQYPQIKYIRHNFEHTHFRNAFNAATVGFAAHEVPPGPRHNLYREAFKALKPKGRLLVFDYASEVNILLRPLLWLWLKAVEQPYGLEYAGEEHHKVLESIGFKLVIRQRLAFLFDASVYTKELKVNKRGKQKMQRGL